FTPVAFPRNDISDLVDFLTAATVVSLGLPSSRASGPLCLRNPRRAASLSCHPLHVPMSRLSLAKNCASPQHAELHLPAPFCPRVEEREPWLYEAQNCDIAAQGVSPKTARSFHNENQILSESCNTITSRCMALWSSCCSTLDTDSWVARREGSKSEDNHGEKRQSKFIRRSFVSAEEAGMLTQRFLPGIGCASVHACIIQPDRAVCALAEQLRVYHGCEEAFPVRNLPRSAETLDCVANLGVGVIPPFLCETDLISEIEGFLVGLLCRLAEPMVPNDSDLIGRLQATSRFDWSYFGDG
ncbi:hypothetical protein RRG08_059017, partial [Elysia crispata]